MSDTTPSNVILREARYIDIPKLAHLHVITWNATYPDEPNLPPLQTRVEQWRRSFEAEDNWFCYVLENEFGKLVGFAKGRKERDGTGNLNKLYLIEEYKYRGLGRLLIGQVARRFLDDGIQSMWVVADTQNKQATAFYEKMGGIRKTDTDPDVALYVWKDITTLINLCPMD